MIIKLVKKLDLPKAQKRRIIVMGTIERVINSYKYIVLLPFIILCLIIGLLEKIVELLEYMTPLGDVISDKLPFIKFHNDKDYKDLTEAIKRHNKIKVV